MAFKSTPTSRRAFWREQLRDLGATEPRGGTAAPPNGCLLLHSAPASIQPLRKLRAIRPINWPRPRHEAAERKASALRQKICNRSTFAALLKQPLPAAANTAFQKTLHLAVRRKRRHVALLGCLSHGDRWQLHPCRGGRRARRVRGRGRLRFLGRFLVLLTALSVPGLRVDLRLP